jgi:hypothetical protein
MHWHQICILFSWPCLLGVLIISKSTEDDVSRLRESAFEAGMVFESNKHIVENYDKAIEKIMS